MFVWKLFFSCLTFYCVHCSLQPAIPQEVANIYGPYRIEFSDLKLCNGPKRKDLTTSSARLVKIENAYLLHMNVTFLERVHLDHIKVIVYILKNNKKSILWSKKVDDPCSFALGEMLDKYFGLGKDCQTLKGEKYYVANVTDLTYAINGKSFYYGNYIMKGITFSNQGNIFCLQLNSLYSKT